MEFEWIPPELTSQNAGQRIFTLGSPPLQASQPQISSPTAPPATAPSSLDVCDTPSASTETHLPLIPSVPVPLITIGKVFAPIPQGRQTILPEAMEAARQLGLAPMLAAAMGTAWSSPDEFWDIASLTDPLTASNLMQVSSSGQKRLLFVERGAAEKLARGKDELILVPETRKNQKIKREDNPFVGFLKALNPMVAFESVCDALQRGMSKAAAMDAFYNQQQKHDSGGVQANEKNSASFNTSTVSVFDEEKKFRIQPVNEDERSVKEAAETETASTSPLFGENEAGNDIFGPLTGNDADRMSTSPSPSSNTSSSSGGGGGMPALAHIPVRLALSLLRGASGRFLLLSGKAENGDSHGSKNKKSKQSGAKKKKMKGGSDGEKNDANRNKNLDNFEQEPDEYGGADSLDSLQVYFLPKCDFIISSTAGDVRFVPGFLSASALQKFYKKGIEEYMKGILTMRKLKRRVMCQRLRLAAAVVAGAGTGGGGDSPSSGFGGGGGGGGGGLGGDDEDDGFGDSPDIYEAIQELTEELPGFTGASPTLGPSSSSLVRAGATLATGILTILGPLIESVGDGIDSAAYFFLHKFDKDFYKLNTASRPLGPLLKSFASYNATQAAALSEKNSLMKASSEAGGANSSPTVLALAGLCMAVGAKLAGDAVSSGPAGIMHSLTTFQRVEQNNTEDGSVSSSGFSMFGAGTGGGWAAVAAAAAAAAAQSNGDSKETELTAILRSVLPSLEFNGFAEALPMGGEDEKKLAAVEETVGAVLLKEGHLKLTAEIDLNANPEQFLEDMQVSTSSGGGTVSENEEKKEGTTEEKIEEKRRPILGRGLILIGDPGRVLGLRTPRGFSLDGVGIPVGVDDGRRYL